MSTAFTPQGTPESRQQDQSLERNSYAVAFRLLGDRPAASAVAGIATQRLRQSGHLTSPNWLAHLTHYTLEQAVDPAALAVAEHEDDEFASLRAALRRRLARATPQERVAAALIHLAGYPVDFVAGVLGRSESETRTLAAVLAPPPGIAYRVLGDPDLTHVRQPDPVRTGRRRWRPRWTTIATVVAVVAVVLVATQITGPRPTLGPPLDAPAVSSDVAPSDPAAEPPG